MSQATIPEQVRAWVHAQPAQDLWSRFDVVRDVAKKRMDAGGSNTYQWKRVRQALFTLMKSGEVGIRAVGLGRADKPYYVIRFTSSWQVDPRIAIAATMYDESAYAHLPARAKIDMGDRETFDGVPIYARAPILLTAYPRGIKLEKLTAIVRTKNAGTVERAILKHVCIGDVSLRWSDKDEKIFIPHPAFHPVVSDLYTPPKLSKPRFSKPIKRRIMDFIWERLKADGEVRAYTASEINEVVDARSNYVLTARCRVLVHEQQLERVVKLSRFTPHNSRPFVQRLEAFKLGYRPWLLHTTEKTKAEAMSL